MTFFMYIPVDKTYLKDILPSGVITDPHVYI